MGKTAGNEYVLLARRLSTIKRLAAWVRKEATSAQPMLSPSDYKTLNDAAHVLMRYRDRVEASSAPPAKESG